MPVRRAERWLRPLLHPRRQPLLGITGPAIPFWDLDGAHPSVAIVEPDRGPIVHEGAGSPKCRFAWRGLWHELPLTGPVLPGARRMLVADRDGLWLYPGDGTPYFVSTPILAWKAPAPLLNPFVMTSGDIDHDGALDLWLAQRVTVGKLSASLSYTEQSTEPRPQEARAPRP